MISRSPFAGILKKKKEIVLGGLLTALLLMLVFFTLFYIPLYSSQAKLFIRNLNKENVVSSYGGGQTVRSESGYSNPLFNHLQILQSESVSRNLYTTLSEKFPKDFQRLGLKSPEKFHDHYLKLIHTKVEPSTDVIKMTFNWVNPQTAPQVFGEVIGQYKRSYLEIQKSVEIRQRQYLEKQLNIISQDLDNIRSQIKSYRIENHTIDISNESSELTRARVQLEQQNEVLKSQISYHQRKLSDYSAQLKVPNAEVALKAVGVGVDPYLISLSQSLAQAQQRYSKLAATFTDNYPDVIEVKNEINSLQKSIDKRKRETLGHLKLARGIYDSPSATIVTEMAKEQADYLSLIAQQKALTAGIATLKGEESEIPLKKMGLDELQKKEAALATAYSNILQKTLEAKIKENQIVDNIFVLDHPSVAKFNLNDLLFKLIGFTLFGFFAAFGVVWIKDGSSDQWSDLSEVAETTGHTVLGVIPWLSEKNYTNGTPIQAPDSIFGISYGNIVNSLINRSYSEEASVLAFVASGRATGHSSIVANLASTLARLNHTTVLLDTDFQHPAKLLTQLGKSPAKGSRDLGSVIQEINRLYRLNQAVDELTLKALVDEAMIPIHMVFDDMPQGQDSKTFYYLCNHNHVGNINEFVSSRGFQFVVRYLKVNHEFVLIDTPSTPVVFPELPAIISQADAVVLIGTMKSNKQEMLTVVQHLESAGSKILGIIPREKSSDLEKYYTRFYGTP